MILSVVIPVYNEKNTILDVLNKVNSVRLEGVKKEIIIVDDFSQDGTRDFLCKLKDNNTRIFYHEKNKGKGYAVRTGLKHAGGDIIIIQDGDLEYDPNDYKKLIKPILSGESRVVYGSRFLGKHNPRYKFLYIGNRFLSFLTSLLYFAKITDMETCYKMFTKDVLSKIKLRSKRFDFEPEITAKILKTRHKIKEVPIWYKCRDFKEGKKIGWKDGLQAVYYLLKYRFLD